MNSSIQKHLPNGKTITIETSWDDGSKYDLRLLELLRKYNLPGIFYVPVYTRGLTTAQLYEIAKTHDIGSHTLTHRVLRLLPEDQEREEIMKSKSMMEATIGRPVTSFCYPKGKYNERTIGLVKEAGYTNARTVDVLHCLLPQNPFRRPTTIHIWRRREYSGSPWIEVATKLFDLVMDPNTDANYFHIWGHGWEIESLKHWDLVEQFFTYMHLKLEGAMSV